MNSPPLDYWIRISTNRILCLLNRILIYSKDPQNLFFSDFPLLDYWIRISTSLIGSLLDVLPSVFSFSLSSRLLGRSLASFSSAIAFLGFQMGKQKGDGTRSKSRPSSSRYFFSSFLILCSLRFDFASFCAAIHWIWVSGLWYFSCFAIDFFWKNLQLGCISVASWCFYCWFRRVSWKL